MASEKIPISFNKLEVEKIEELASLMFEGDVYGGFPKAVKFGINLALSCIKNPQKVYSDLDAQELDLFFKSVKRAEIRARLQQEAEDLEKRARKV